MKVLILSHDLKFKGGVVNYTNLLISKLSGKITFDRFIVGKRLKESNWIFRFFFFPVYDSLKLFVKVTTNNYSLIHLNPSLDIKSILREGLFMIVLKAARRKNILLFWHGWKNSIGDIIVSKKYFRWGFRKIFGKASLMLVLSSSIRDSLIKIGIDSSIIRVTKTMFDGNIFSGVKDYYSNKNAKILYLSSLSKTKGVYELLQAFELVNAKFTDTKLIVAGDGPERSPMEKWVQKHNLTQKVCFRGYLRGKEKAKILLESNIFVLPSYSEGCPVALVEALGAGLAIIATPVGAIPEVIENDLNGRLLANNTPIEIAEAIYRLLEDKNYAKKIRQNNKLKAWTNYEANVISSQMGRFYREIADLD